MYEMRREEIDLWDGVILGDVRKVQLALRDGAWVNVHNGREETPLCVALELGHTEIVEILLKRGATMRREVPIYLGSESELAW